MRNLYPIVVTFLLVCSVLTSELFGQDTYPGQVSTMRLLGKSIPVRSMDPSKGFTSDGKKEKAKSLKPNFGDYHQIDLPYESTAAPKGGDPLYQLGTEKNLFNVDALSVIDGMDQSQSGATPPDTDGDVSEEHYIQAINATVGAIFQIFDKQGNALSEPLQMNQFWTPFNRTGLGDPIVLYDHDEKRWILTEFSSTGNILLVAVSETSDPFGSYFAYEFQTPDFPDYPKYSVWTHSIFVTTNEIFEDGVAVYAFDKAALYSGAEEPGVQRFEMPKFDWTGFQVATPIDWDGPMAPPDSTSFAVLRLYDDSWDGGEDKIEIWKLDINWDSTGNSSIKGPFDLFPAPFETGLCQGGGIFNCLRQPSGPLLSAIPYTIYNRVQYRRFGTHETIVLNFSVDVTGLNQAGIRWMELRKTAEEDWSIYQEGTYAPDDVNRFMGSISMDDIGNILLGYSITSDSLFPSLRFTGRLADDPLGQMTIEENEFGTSLSSSPSTRWGDYSSMTVDPSDNRTFWFTGEYMLEDFWGTKIMTALLRKDSNDVGVTALLNPQNSGFLTDSEEVTVTIGNFGFKPASNFDVSMEFEGNLIATETITDTIPPGSRYDYTFTPTVDLSALGDYGFLFYTTMASDTAFFNDTLRTVVTQLTRDDVALENLIGIDRPICSDTLPIEVVFRNVGVDTLESLVISYSVNGGAEMSMNWTGKLPFGLQESVMIEVVSTLGINTINIRLSEPNDVTDQNQTNNSLSRNFDRFEANNEFRIELLTDRFPDETSWTVTNDQDSVLFSGGPFEDPQTLITEFICLPEGCFNFNLLDAFGDGIQAQGVEGNYRIFNADGVVVASLMDPDFGFRETNEICTDFECTVRASFTVVNESAPGEENGRIFVTGNFGSAPYQYSIDGGETFRNGGFFINLPAGTYDVVVKDDRNCEYLEQITVFACDIELSAEVTNTSEENANDGAIEIITTGGNGPLEFSLDNSIFQDSTRFDSLVVGSYTIYARDTVGCEAEIDLEIDFSTSANEDRFFGRHIEILPNPTEGYFRINVKGLLGVNTLPFRIYDANGKVVQNNRMIAYDDVLTQAVSIQHLPSGIYYVRISHEGWNRMLQVVKK